VARDEAGFGESARAEVFRADGAREEVAVTLAAEDARARARRILAEALRRARDARAG
jgi:hypothetical protein